MELDVTGVTTADNNQTVWPSIIIHDNVTYTQRYLTLSIEFLSGQYMHIEQKEEYTGGYIYFKNKG
jgi:hypothetical protein